jgi:hypothetical protein
MWVYLPKECVSSVCSQDAEVSISDSPSPFQRVSAFVTSSRMRMPARYWQLAWKKKPYLQRLSGVTLPLSTVNRGVAQWIASWADFPASTSVSLEKWLGSTESQVASGESSHGLLARYDLGSSMWRMSQLSLLPGLDEFSETWPASGTMRNGACRALPASEPRTSEEDSSSSLMKEKLWPTPTATPYGSSQNGINGKGGEKERPSAGTPSLENQARALWATPTVKGGHMVKGQGTTTGDGLVTQARQWNTPRSRDYKQGGKDCLTSDIQTFQASRPSSPLAQGSPTSGSESAESAPTSPPRLNPRFVEWMQNWPLGWSSTNPLEASDYERWATASRLWLQQLLSER